MPARILLSDGEASTVFALIGTGEVAMTYSLGWTLGRCDLFRQALLRRVLGDGADVQGEALVHLERSVSSAGRTDVEVRTPAAAIVIEAKRGFGLPTHAQLRMYLPRLDGRVGRALVTVSDYGAPVALKLLGAELDGVPIVHLAWGELSTLATAVRPSSPLDQRRLLADFVTYIGSVIAMQKLTSNEVFVVALNPEPIGATGPSSIELVRTRSLYAHPLGPGWPADPPNYLGFRWGGVLQSIHHVETTQPIDDLHDIVAEVPPGVSGGPLLCYHLGPAILPPQVVRSGPVRDRRMHAAIDLLLTSATIGEAATRTKARFAQASPPV